jgi:hypothetical protein
VLQRGINEFQEEDRTNLSDIYDMCSLEFENPYEIKYEFRHSATEMVGGRVWITAQSQYSFHSKVHGMECK